MFVPFGDERMQLGFEVGDVEEVGRGESFSLQNREPLLDLIHARAVNWCEVKPEARVPF